VKGVGSTSGGPIQEAIHRQLALPVGVGPQAGHPIGHLDRPLGDDRYILRTADTVSPQLANKIAGKAVV
jgi:hypothetical protein